MNREDIKVGAKIVTSRSGLGAVPDGNREIVFVHEPTESVVYVADIELRSARLYTATFLTMQKDFEIKSDPTDLDRIREAFPNVSVTEDKFGYNIVEEGGMTFTIGKNSYHTLGCYRAGGFPVNGIRQAIDVIYSTIGQRIRVGLEDIAKLQSQVDALERFLSKDSNV